MNTHQIETELWEAADQLRANSKLTAAEYSMPVLGLISLRSMLTFRGSARLFPVPILWLAITV